MELKEERLLLLNAWREVEKEKGDDAGLAAVEAKVPQKLKKKRMVTNENGEEMGWEEYYDYHFPDDQVRGG
jgi:crooked neck